jgi:hypothetical protein
MEAPNFILNPAVRTAARDRLPGDEAFRGTSGAATNRPNFWANGHALAVCACKRLIPKGEILADGHAWPFGFWDGFFHSSTTSDFYGNSRWDGKLCLASCPSSAFRSITAGRGGAEPPMPMPAQFSMGTRSRWSTTTISTGILWGCRRRPSGLSASWNAANSAACRSSLPLRFGSPVVQRSSKS